MRAIVHVNRHLIAKNRKDGRQRPIYAVKQRDGITYAHGLTIEGHVRFIDPRAEPALPCGATIYAVVDGIVALIDPCSYQDIEKS